MTPADDLTPQQCRVLADLLAGETISAAARNHGVHRATVHNWLRDDIRFRAALDQGRARLQTLLYDTVQELAMEALDKIRQLLSDPAASPSVQLRAAALILKMAQPSFPPAAVRRDVETEQMIQHVMDNQSFHEAAAAQVRQNSTPHAAGDEQATSGGANRAPTAQAPSTPPSRAPGSR